MGGRKGWSSIEVPGGWLQVVRGPRPPASKWPQAQRTPSAAVQKAPPSERQGGRWRNRGVDPDTKMAEAHAKVERLQKALDALGNLGGPEVDAIKRSLKKAQEAARERPVGVLVKECKEFIDRSTKRITKLKAELDAETVLLQESRARLSRLEAQEVATPPTLVDTGRGAQVVNLQQMVNQLQAERDALSQELRRSRAPKDKKSWAGDAPPDLSSIPPVPDDHQAIEEWMTARNQDLRNALEFGTADVISQVSNMLAQEASKLAAQRGALVLQPMEVQSLGSRMVAIIDEADAKRRCLEH